jgi:predicted RNA-binding Zn-ribbon protein involved in translation (DUF1610 family)
MEIVMNEETTVYTCPYCDAVMPPELLEQDDLFVRAGISDQESQLWRCANCGMVFDT